MIVSAPSRPRPAASRCSAIGPSGIACWRITATLSRRSASRRRNNEVDEWTLKPNRPNNHLFDTLVGALVAASIEGCRLPTAGLDELRRRVPKVITRDTLQLQRRRA